LRVRDVRPRDVDFCGRHCVTVLSGHKSPTRQLKLVVRQKIPIFSTFWRTTFCK
jgi:hypothetical protein